MGQSSHKPSSFPRLSASDIGRKLVMLAMLFIPALSYANEGFNGFCQDGGISIITVGMSSTNQAQGSVPGCTVTVNIHGGGAATIFKDNINTPLSNPFTASLTDGSFLFYAATGRYDINVFSAGVLNYTYTDVILYDQSAVGQSFVSPIITGGSTTTGGANADAFNITTRGDRAIVLQNPDFEGSSLLPPPGWITINGSPTLSYETSSPAPNKLQTLKIAGTSGQGVQQFSRFSVFVGETYSISAVAKSDGTAHANLILEAYDKNQNPLGAIISLTTVSTSYVTLSGSGTVPSTAVSALVLLEVGTSTGTAWFDQVRVLATTNPAGAYTSPVFNATTGYQIAGAAPSNHLPLGNGNNYVDASLLPTAAGGLGVSAASVTAHNYFGNDTGSSAAGAFVRPVPADITPGTNGQCVTTISGTAAWGGCGAQVAGTPNVTGPTGDTVNAASSGQQEFATLPCTTISPCFSSGQENSLGKTFDFEVFGTFTPVNTTETIQFSAWAIDPSLFFSVISFVPSSTASGNWHYKVTCTTTTTGASGVISCASEAQVNDGANKPFTNNTFFTVTFNLTTESNFFGVAVEFSTASATNSAAKEYSVLHYQN